MCVGVIYGVCFINFIFFSECFQDFTLYRDPVESVHRVPPTHLESKRSSPMELSMRLTLLTFFTSQAVEECSFRKIESEPGCFPS